MLNYFRAYVISRLQEFPEWSPNESGDSGPEQVVFVDTDLVVRSEPVPEAPALFVSDSEAWAAFCRERLEFVVPDWDEESAAVRRVLDANVS